MCLIPSDEPEEKLRLDVSDAIMEWLVTEKKFILEEGRLLQLPCRFTAEKIIQLYLNIRKFEADQESFEFSDGVAAFLINLFDLHYRGYFDEREEGRHVWFTNKRPRECYGALHLVRLILDIPPECYWHIPFFREELELMLRFIDTSLDIFVSESNYVLQATN